MIKSQTMPYIPVEAVAEPVEITTTRRELLTVLQKKISEVNNPELSDAYYLFSSTFDIPVKNDEPIVLSITRMGGWDANLL